MTATPFLGRSEGGASRLTEVVSIRLTAAEMEALRAVAGDQPLSKFVRELCSDAITAQGTTAHSGLASHQTAVGCDVPFTITMNIPEWSCGPSQGVVLSHQAAPRF